MPPAAADHDRLPTLFGLAQQLDRRVKGVHVEMSDEARFGEHRRQAGWAVLV